MTVILVVAVAVGARTLPAQSTNGAADSDGDGWCDARELAVGTGINKPCATTGFPPESNRNDEAEDGIPVDFNDDRAVNIVDRGLMLDKVLEFQDTGVNIPRFDLNDDGAVHILDRSAVVASNGFIC